MLEATRIVANFSHQKTLTGMMLHVPISMPTFANRCVEKQIRYRAVATENLMTCILLSCFLLNTCRKSWNGFIQCTADDLRRENLDE